MTTKPRLHFPFPYATSWPIQQSLMESVYSAIDQGHVGVFESPTGTGKSLSLISASLKWLSDEAAKSIADTVATRTNDRLSTIVFDPADPDWVRDAERKKIEREVRNEIEDELAARKKREERLAKIRRQEREIGFKRHAALEPDDEDFLVEEYDSDNEDVFKKSLLRSDLDSDTEEGQEDDEEPFQELKIFYCSRTHSQLSQFISELKKTEYVETVKSLSLGSRKNLCINDQVTRLSSAPRMNDKCLDLQKDKANKCPYLPKEKRPLRDFSDTINATVRDIEELAELGKAKGVCPYYGTRAALPSSQIVTLPYNMMLQKSTRESLGIKLKGNIVIFDEAHNIIDTITSIYSITLELHQIQRAHFQLQSYLIKYSNRLKGKNVVYIKQILILLTAMQQQLTDANTLASKSKEQPQLPFKTSSDFVNDLGVDHINLFKVNTYLETSKLALKVQGFTEKGKTGEVITETTDTFTPKHIPSLQQVQTFIQSLLNTSLNGRIGTITPSPTTHPLQTHFKYLLLSPTDVFQEIVSSSRAVILAGGTMEPMSEFKAQLLDFVDYEKVDYFSCGHIVPASSILTVSVGVGAGGGELDFRYENRMNEKMIIELGNTITALCTVCPAGAVCFFVSYSYMDHVLAKWKASGILSRLEGKKKAFVEPRNARGVEACLAEYSAAITGDGAKDGGKRNGAILFCVVGGKMSEGINFSDDMARSVFMVGLPYPSKTSPELAEKMRYIDSRASASGITSSEYYENLCMRALNQSIGRAIRHKNDYAAIFLLDKRFKGARIREKLPGWIKSAGVVDVPTFGAAVGKAGQFFRAKKEVN
ncbi:DEAD H (Asp-Glu-Ala-Asp His) box helicase 11 [Rhizoclosmatium sp. JEL0117]|nr:DEAD H (Asp-Glu-Ala-Asp His) box helicase 11 [Rhizoclosmatium sp. JEL0117]